MLWKKAWLDTRWPFLIGLALLLFAASLYVLFYPHLRERGIDYRAFVWSGWFQLHLPRMATLFAAILGSGGFFAARAGRLYTLALPVTRRRLYAVHAATGLAELLALVLVPSLLIVLAPPILQKSHAARDAAVHAVFVFVGAAIFMALASLLSTVFGDIWRPVVITLFAAAVIFVFGIALPELWYLGLLRVMNGEAYFRDGTVPWAGLFASTLAAAALHVAASARLARRDF